MSQQSLAKTQQILTLVGQQLPAIFEAANTANIDLNTFVLGTLIRAGAQPTDDVVAFAKALTGLMTFGDPPQIVGTGLPVADAAV